MKVERKSQGFQPVIITLESQEEIDQLYHILVNTEIENTGLNNFDNQLCSYLEDKIVEGYEARWDEDDECIRLVKF